MELIFEESIRINGDDSEEDKVIIDPTVQEKNITFPTGSKPHTKIIKKCSAIAEEENIEVRQSYKRVLKKLSIDQRFRTHPKNKGKARKRDKKIKTIAGRLLRELERKIFRDSRYYNDLELFKKCCFKSDTVAKKYIRYMNQMLLVLVKAKSKKDMSLVTKYP